MMTIIINTVCLLLVAVGIFQRSVGISWEVKPDAFTYGPQGTNISIRWNYKLESNEEFLTSVIHYKGNDLASRHPGEDNYARYVKEFSFPFSVSGSTDITLTVHNAKVLYNGKFCCEIDYKSAAGKLKTEECSTLYAYVLPVISYHTPDLTTKQGDVIKLQCNATGYPEPSGAWIDRDADKTIANFFKTSLNVISKRTGGTYCCKTTNRFGEQTKCSSINVTEYQPQGTTLTSQAPYIIMNKRFQAQCTADAYPPPYYIFKQNNTQMQNSTKGVYVSDKITDGDAIQVSCVPWNKYGAGPEKKIILPVKAPEPPKFSSDLRTSYNLTGKCINLTCRATGVPAPNISWTRGESTEVISNKEYYEVHYECTNDTLIFYCNASNDAGSIRSPQIKVQLHPDASCIPQDKNGSSNYEPPKISVDLVTSYNITTNSINITCKATGIPKPSITWTKGESNEVIGTKEYYEVPFINYEESRLIFYCHASNVLGKVRSSEIRVNVMTKAIAIGLRFCAVVLKGITDELVIIIAVSLTVVVLLAMVLVVLSRVWRKRTSRLKEIKESLVEPIDAVPITISGKLGEVVPHHEGHYAAIEEVENKKEKRKKETPAKGEKPAEKKAEDPVYAVVKKKPRTNETV